MKRFIVLAVVALFAPAVAFAGGYAGISGGGTKTQNWCDGVPAAEGVSCDDTDRAFRVYAGAQVHRNLALEVGYIDFGKVTGSVSGTFTEEPQYESYSSGAPIVHTESLAVSVKATAFDALLVPTVPLGDKVSLYGKVGVYHADLKGTATATLDGQSASMKEKHSVTDLTWGLGAAWHINKNWMARVDWQRYEAVGNNEIGKSDVDFAGAGVALKF